MMQALEKMKTTKQQLVQALQVAAESAYVAEVLETEMEVHVIGAGRDWASREEWIEQRVSEWVEAGRNLEVGTDDN